MGNRLAGPVMGHIVWNDGYFGSAYRMGMRMARNVRLPNGDRVNAYPSHDGIADTFFSIPAYVHYKGRRVYGYITADNADDVEFRPYKYRKHWRLVMPVGCWMLRRARAGIDHPGASFPTADTYPAMA